MTKVGETISAEQFNQTYPVGATISGEEFNKKYSGGTTDKKTDSGWGTLGGGLVGAVGGQILGGPVGGAALGGIGQAGGRMLELGIQNKSPLENLPEPLRNILGILSPKIGILNKLGQMTGAQPYTPEETRSVASEGLQGMAYGAVPGSVFGKKALEWTVGKPLAGAVVGGGTQAIRNIQEGQPLTKDVASQAMMTGGLNTLIPGVGKLVGGSLKYAGKTVPKDLYKSLVEEPAKKAVQLYRAVQEKMVGFKNVDFSLKNGIIRPNEALTNEHLSNAVDRTNALLQQKEDVLQQILGAENVQVPSQDIFPKLMKIIDSSIPSKDVPDLQPLRVWMLQQAQEDAVKTGNANVPAVVEDLMTGKYPVSLSKINEIKRAFGENYKESSLHRKLYSTIRQYIEDASGVPQGVKTINREMGELINVKDNLLKIETTIPDKYTQESIEAAIQKSKETSPHSLKTAVALGSIVGGGLLGKTVGGAMGLPAGIGSGLAGGALGYFQLMNMLSSSGAKEALKTILENTAGKVSDAGTKMQLGKILQQLGVRLPGLLQ